MKKCSNGRFYTCSYSNALKECKYKEYCMYQVPNDNRERKCIGCSKNIVWEEKLEDEINEDMEYGYIYVYDENGACKLKSIIEKYLGNIWLIDKDDKVIRTALKVKIQAKKDCIQIERID